MATEFQPYVGPRPFERNDLSPFFGRDHEADELVSLIFSSRELLFYAQSGIGKTSLLNARIIPLLENEGFEVLPLARVQGVIPKDIQPDGIKNLYVFNTLMSWAKEEANPKRFVRMSLTEFLKERKRPTDSEGEPLARALIFDQVEELFTLYQDRWKDRNEFFEQIRDALKFDDRLLRVIFTIREDYIAQLDPFAPLLPEKLRTRFRMERLRRDAALSAVTGPLRETKRSFAKGVAEKLVEDLLKTRVETITGETIEVTGEFVEPVQLQVVCQNLWQEIPSDVTEITEQHLLAFGGVDRPLSRFYESAVKQATVEAGIKEEELRQWCEKWLITSTGTRNIVHRGTQFTEGISTIALDILVAYHLINLELRAGARWYELTHDRLIDPIRASNERWNKQREEKANQASHLVRRAEQSISMEKYERALDAARNAYALSEEVGDLQGEAIALLYHGKAYEGLKQYNEALPTYARALAIVKQTNAREVETYLLLTQGSLFMQMEKYEEAVQCYTNYINLMLDDSIGYYNRGLAYSGLKQYERAIEDYNRALEFDPKDVDAYKGRGNTYSNLKQYERAIEDYNHALELDPKDVDTYIGRGNAYYDLKKYEQAFKDYNRALELDPKSVYAYHGRGNAYSDLKEYERAIKDYDRAIELDPKYDEAYYMRGLTYLWLRDIQSAQIDFKRSWQLDSTDVNYGWVIEWANMCQEEPGLETAGRLEKIAAIAPNVIEAYICRGVAFWIRERFVEAIAELNQAIPLNPELEDIFFWKGMILAYLGQDDDAIAAIEKPLELGLQPILLLPLRWTEQDRPDFYRKYAVPLLARYEM